MTWLQVDFADLGDPVVLRGGKVLSAISAGLAFMALVVPGIAAGQEAGVVAAGKKVYEEANCVGCHKWHGGGGGGYGGAALSLRTTTLNHDQLIEVVRCGRPGTGMPYHDREAYRDDRCYGMTKADVGSDIPPKSRKSLTEADMEAVVAYVEAAIKGKDAPTYEDCVAFWGESARECQSMK